MENFFQFTIAAIGGVASWLVGGWSILLTALLILNTFDFISGMAANWGDINSKRGFQGIIKKGLMWVWIVIANLIHLVLVEQGLTAGQVIPNAVAVMFILNEIVSLSENSSRLGVDMPEPIKRALSIFEKKTDEEKGNK